MQTTVGGTMLYLPQINTIIQFCEYIHMLDFVAKLSASRQKYNWEVSFSLEKRL